MSIKTAPERFWDKVDKSGDCWLWTGATLARGHGQFNVGRSGGRNELILAHRYSYELAFGSIPEGVLLDHKCHIRKCVNPSHLRPATYKENAENRAGANVTSKSGIRGVYWHKQRKKWAATVGHEGKSIYLGLFASKEEAAVAARTKRDELFTHNVEGLRK